MPISPGVSGRGLAAAPVSPLTSSDTLEVALALGRRALLARQAEDGHWVGELQGDTILESEWILLLAFLGREDDPRVRRAANYLLEQQLPSGGWNNYPGGPSELSVSVKAYFALKIAGHEADAPHMVRAKETILRLGGAASCNSFTKFYLALLGQLPYANCPAVPPELMLLPRWFYINIYAMSAWTRTILVPLALFCACKPVRRLPPERGIRELFVRPPGTRLWPHPPTKRWLTWTNLFLLADQAFKLIEPLLGPIRRLAVQKATRWLFDHFQDSDGVGAIFPPMIYTCVCLRCLGYADDSPEMTWALKQLDDLVIEQGDTIRLQPCFSPVWDTALTLNALADSGLSVTHPGVRLAVRWLQDREVRRPGDWSLTNPNLPPAGWYFEYRNGQYPDTDDTAMVLMALAKTGASETDEGREPAERGLRWLLGMQNRDGGWAAFDRNIDRQLLTQVPFADHNAMLDPSCPDITARVLEALGYYGFRPEHPQVRRALVFLRRTQNADGAWIGRWGVNYIYGTWQVLQGLASIGVATDDRMMRRGAAWLMQVQQPSGAWGESCASYDDPSLAGRGSPTASQTAWALLALIAAGEGESDAVRRGVEWLLATQKPDGVWQEKEFTGTGFPRVFYLKYHMYSLYFPMMALARYQRLQHHGLRLVG